MPFKSEGKFVPLAESSVVVVKGAENEKQNESFKLQQEQIRLFNGKVLPTNLPNNRRKTLQQHPITSTMNKTFTCWLILSLVLFMFFVFLLSLTFVIAVGFIVKCDESKLTDHYDKMDKSTGLDEVVHVIPLPGPESLHDWSSTWQQHLLEKEKYYRSQKIKWIPNNDIDKNTMSKLEPAGVERYEARPTNELFFVARTLHGNGTVVGKYCPMRGNVYYGYQGKEYIKKDFEILMYPPGVLSWIPSKVNNVPDEHFLVFGGDAPVTGESTYICRANHDKNLVLGKYVTGSGACLVPYWGNEYRHETFELLVVNAIGRLLGVES